MAFQNVMVCIFYALKFDIEYFAIIIEFWKDNGKIQWAAEVLTRSYML